MSLNIITNCTPAPKPAVNEISPPTAYNNIDDYIVLHYIIQLL